MMNYQQRTQLLIGEEAVKKLNNSRILVFGIGGVGSHLTEALARAGVGTLFITDSDKVDVTNINRQSIALHSTVGRYKTEVMKEKLEDINPDIRVFSSTAFILPENTEEFFNSLPFVPDYIADCIDTVSAKLSVIEYADSHGIPIISCMGTGNKLHPEMFKIADINSTKVCPLCRVMRKELKARGIEQLKVLYSEEPVISKGDTVASISYVPSAAGLMIAGEIIRTLIK